MRLKILCTGTLKEKFIKCYKKYILKHQSQPPLFYRKFLLILCVVLFFFLFGFMEDSKDN